MSSYHRVESLLFDSATGALAGYVDASGKEVIGGFGVGGVASVNNVNPDGGGNVKLSPGNIQAVPQVVTAVTWDANANALVGASGSLASSTVLMIAGVPVYAILVSVAGTTALDGVSKWNVGDAAYIQVNGAGTGVVWARSPGIPVTTLIVKGDGAGGLIQAIPGLDYQLPPTTLNVPIVFLPITGTTIASGGAVTLTQALDAAYPAAWFYMTAAAINTGQAAGLFFGTMSDTTHVQLYQNTYTPGSNKSTDANNWHIPATPTAWGATTPGTLALPGAYIPVFTLFAPQNSLGPSGWGSMDFDITTLGNANSKAWHVTFGGSGNSVSTGASSTTSTIMGNLVMFNNAGAVNRQRGYMNGATSPYFTGATAPTTLAVDTSSAGNKNFSLEVTYTNAADYMVVQRVASILSPGTP